MFNYPSEAPKASDYKVWVNGDESWIYDTPVAAICSFESTDSVAIKVWVEQPFSEVVVRPLRLGIKPLKQGQLVSFTLPKNTKATLEFDKRIYRPLHVFAQEPFEPSMKQKADIVFEAGKMYYPGNLYLKSGQKVFIEGGAVVEGSIHFYETKGVEIMGHGILENRNKPNMVSPMCIKGIQSSGFQVKGIHIIGNPTWTSAYFDCSDFTVDDVRIIGWRPTDDGMDIVGCERVVIKNSYIRTMDDCIAIKAKTVSIPALGRGNTYAGSDEVSCKRVDDIFMTNNILWNADWGNAIEIGFECRADSMTNIRFIDNDIIHVEANGGVFSIHNGDRAVVNNVLYKNIRIEDARGFLCHFQILKSHYTKDKERGQGRNIVLENVHVLNGVPLNSLITGYDAEHTYENILFKNVQIHGRKVTDIFSGNIFTEFAHKINFE